MLVTGAVNVDEITKNVEFVFSPLLTNQSFLELARDLAFLDPVSSYSDLLRTRQLDEAVTIDGASSATILLRIVGLLLAPGLMATGLSVFSYVWQELMIFMTFVRTDRLKPLMAGVSTFITSKGIEWGP